MSDARVTLTGSEVEGEADMSVVCDALSVLVAVDVLDRVFPGGAAGYEQAVPNRTFCTDGSLTRVGFMHPNDVAVWTEHLQDKGLTFAVERSGRWEAVDIVVVDQVHGPTCWCDWVATKVIDGVRRAWLLAVGPGALMGPQGWTPADSAGLAFHPPEEVRGMPIARGDVMDESIDPRTGDTLFLARPFPAARRYDEAVDRARRELALNDARESYRQIRRAEGFRALTDDDQLLAARICSRLCDEGVRALAPEAARRWAEVTVLGVGRAVPHAWYLRGRAELVAGSVADAEGSLLRAVDLDPRHAYAWATRALVASLLNRPGDVVLRLLDRAESEARHDPAAVVYVARLRAALEDPRGRNGH